MGKLLIGIAIVLNAIGCQSTNSKGPAYYKIQQSDIDRADLKKYTVIIASCTMNPEEIKRKTGAKPFCAFPFGMTPLWGDENGFWGGLRRALREEDWFHNAKGERITDMGLPWRSVHARTSLAYAERLANYLGKATTPWQGLYIDMWVARAPWHIKRIKESGAIEKAASDDHEKAMHRFVEILRKHRPDADIIANTKVHHSKHLSGITIEGPTKVTNSSQTFMHQLRACISAHRPCYNISWGEQSPDKRLAMDGCLHTKGPCQ